jgi:hypothetical protein
MSNQTLAISGITIHQDEQGRFCLNDLHKASGGEQKHQPSNWLRNQQTIDLIGLLKSEESITGIRVILTKQGLGTYVVKELVYAYAMWISPKFHLQVIRAYDALVTGTFRDTLTEFLKPITETITLRDFEWRKQVIYQAFENLEKAQVSTMITISGKELLASKCFEK